MDPFSVTVGVIGVVDAGISLSKELKGKIDDFNNAEREVIELAHEIDLCTTLLDVLGDNFDRPENAYPKNVVKQTRRLVMDMRAVFEDVKSMIAEFDYSHKASAKYLMNAEALRGHHEKLKGLQLSFIFMLSVCPPQRTPIQAATSGAAVTQLGFFEGTIQHLPIYNASKGPTGDAPVTYQATLTLQQFPSAPASAGAQETPNIEVQQDTTDRLEEAQKNKRLKRKLAALTSNPFFSKDTFGSIFAKPTPYTKAATYELVEDFTEMREADIGRKEETLERMAREPQVYGGEDDRRKVEAEMKGLEEEIAGLREEAKQSQQTPQDPVPSETEAERDADDILTYLLGDDDNQEEARESPPEVVFLDETNQGPSPPSPDGADRRPPSRYSTPPSESSQRPPKTPVTSY